MTTIVRNLAEWIGEKWAPEETTGEEGSGTGRRQKSAPDLLEPRKQQG